MKQNVSPEQSPQGTLLVHDPLEHKDVPNPALMDAYVPPSPEVLDYDPAKHDPNPGLSTPLAEGWGVMHDVIKDIARARSNRGFTKLPTDSKPVRDFARTIEATPAETHEVVDWSGDKKYERAQFRLNGYREKQVRRALGYNAYRGIVDNQIIEDILPQDVGSVEHRFFYARDEGEAKAKAKNRRVIANFVKKHRV